MTPEEIYDKHELNACVEGGDICNGCLEPWPCDAFLMACSAEEQTAAAAKLVADLIAQRDSLLDAYPR